MPKGTCSVATCERQVKGRGWCSGHYQRWSKHGDPLAGGAYREPGEKPCAISDCIRPSKSRGWCNAHYENWRRNGDPLPRINLTLEERFWPKVVRRSSGCWVWAGSRNKGGYGHLGLPPNGQRQGMAHRVAYELLVGPIPDGLELDHLCRYTSCVNPAHLQPVTHKINIERATWACAKAHRAKTHCPQGHPYSGDNLAMYGGKRCCRTCMRASNRRYEQRKAAERRHIKERSCPAGRGSGSAG